MSDMKNLFFIVKGQYKRGATPTIYNYATGDTNYIGGYNPADPDTEEWYMLMDNKTFFCLACGNDLDKILHVVYRTIKRYNGVARKYFKHLSDITSDDYYEVHYLDHKPLDSESRAKKAEGRIPRVTMSMRCLYNAIYKQYGNYYSEEIEEMEELAYSEILLEDKEKETTHLKKRKLKRRVKLTLVSNNNTIN